MPWLKENEREKHHFCNRPTIVFYWRKIGDLWQCSDCGYIYKLMNVNRKNLCGVWILHDSRGWREGKRPDNRNLKRGYRPKLSFEDSLKSSPYPPKPPGGAGGGSKKRG